MKHRNTSTAGRQLSWLLLGLALVLLSMPGESRAERIKDVASVAGVRSNQLVGYGLVVGLDGTGDQHRTGAIYHADPGNMLAEPGHYATPPGINPQLQNIAAVAVSADLQAFAKPGQTIDVTVSSIANAKSLRGGTLLITQLKGLDGQTSMPSRRATWWSAASGPRATTAHAFQSIFPASVGYPTVRRWNGKCPTASLPETFCSWTCTDPTSLPRRGWPRGSMKCSAAAPLTPLTPLRYGLRAPISTSQRIAFMSEIENLSFEPGEAPARVIINSRTGTVVISANVRVTPAAVSHGSLVVSITEDFDVSQPGPFARQGDTVTTPDSTIDITQEGSRMFLFEPGVELDEIVRAVNEVGAAPGDLVAILEALREAGALRAELLVI